jgi:DnaJ like chaperone protein
MGWWGKVLGGAFGYMLGGPIGAMLGAAVGHQFDKGLAREGAGPSVHRGVDPERIQTVFFTTVFSVMGHIAKADGRVTEHEISMARTVMRNMSLNKGQSRIAIDLFNHGKQADFDLDGVIAQFKTECHRRRTLFLMFMEILMHAAYADGVLHPARGILTAANKFTSRFFSREFRSDRSHGPRATDLRRHGGGERVSTDA